MPTNRITKISGQASVSSDASPKIRATKINGQASVSSDAVPKVRLTKVSGQASVASDAVPKIRITKVSAQASITLTFPVPIPTDLPLLFALLTIAGTTYPITDVPGMSDPRDWYEGYKEPILLRISPITRELSRDGYRTMRFSIDVADPDRTFRGLAATGTIEGAYVRVYIVDDAVRRAFGDAFQIAAGYVVDFEAIDPFKFTFHVEDVLGRVFSETLREREIPSHKLTLTEFWGLDPSYDGRVGPVLVGVLRRPGYGVAQGVFMGEINLRDITPLAPDKAVYVLLFSEGALSAQADFYYNSDVWQANKVIPLGYYVHPTEANDNGYVFVCTTAGTTGASEPSWPTSSTVPDGTVVWTTYGPDNAGNLRFVVPDDAFGATGPLFAPHKPNWSIALPGQPNYVDWNGRRYGGLLFIDKTHPYAEAVKEGRITVTLDGDGHAANANGTGGVIRKPGAVIRHVIKNCVLSESTWLAYNSTPTFDDGTEVIDEASFDAADARTDGFIAGGYECGLQLGRRGSPQRSWSAVREIQEGTGYELSPSWRGQLMCDVEDPDAAAEVSLNATDDLIRLVVRIDKEHYANRVDARYGFLLRDPVPLRTPAPHSPSASKTLPLTNEWESDTVIFQSGAGQAAVRRTQIYPFDNYAVRDPFTAEDVAVRYLNRFVGPPASLDGARVFELVTGLQGLGKDGTVIELGSVIALSHPEGLSGSGYTDWRGRVTLITVDPQACKVTVRGRVLDETAPPFVFEAGTVVGTVVESGSGVAVAAGAGATTDAVLIASLGDAAGGMVKPFE